MGGRGNYCNIDYPVRRERSVAPINHHNDYLDVRKLTDFSERLNGYIEALAQTEIITENADYTRLFEINRAICEEMSYGGDDFDAIIQVSIKHQLPLHDVFLAYNIKRKYQHHHEQFAISMVVKILHELGFKNIQIYRKMPTLSMRRVAEIIKSWENGDYLLPNYLLPVIEHKN